MDFFYRRKPWYAGQFVRKIVAKFELSEKNILYFSVIFNKQKSILLSWLVRDVDEAFLNAKIQLPTKNGKIDFDFMENFIADLEEERIAELEAYLLSTWLKDYTLTTEEERVLREFESGEVEWGVWRTEELFEKINLRFLKPTFNKENDVSREKTNEFNLPLVNAKNGDNGIMYYGRSMDFESVEMSIDIVNDGAISTWNVYSQPQKTWVLYNAYLIKPKYCSNKQWLHFFTTSLHKSIKLKFGYENKASWEKVKEENISLPIKNNELDYAMMEVFISAIQKLVIRDVVEYVDRKIVATRRAVSR